MPDTEIHAVVRERCGAIARRDGRIASAFIRATKPATAGAAEARS